MSRVAPAACNVLRRIGLLFALLSATLAFIYALSFVKVGDEVVIEGASYKVSANSHRHVFLALSPIVLASTEDADICNGRGDTRVCRCGDNNVTILQDKISQSEAEHCIGFCGNSDNFPFFVKSAIAIQTFFKAWVSTPILRQLPDAAVRMWTGGECFDKQGFKEFWFGGAGPCEPALRPVRVPAPAWVSFGSFWQHCKDLYSTIFFYNPRSIIMSVFQFFVRHGWFNGGLPGFYGWIIDPFIWRVKDGWFIIDFLKGMWISSTHLGMVSVIWSWSQLTHPWWVLGWTWFLVPLEIIINCVLFVVHTFLLSLIFLALFLLLFLVVLVLTCITVPLLFFYFIWIAMLLMWYFFKIFFVGVPLMAAAMACLFVVFAVVVFGLFVGIFLPGGILHAVLVVLFGIPDVIARFYGWISLWPSAMWHTFLAHCKDQHFPAQTLHKVWAWAPTVIKWSWDRLIHPWWIVGWPWYFVPFQIIFNAFLFPLQIIFYLDALCVGVLTWAADLALCIGIAIYGSFGYVLTALWTLVPTAMMILVWTAYSVITIIEIILYVMITALFSITLMFLVVPVFFAMGLLYGSAMYLIHGYTLVVCFKSVVGYVFGGMATNTGPIFAVICLVVGARIASYTNNFSVEFDIEKMYPHPFKNDGQIIIHPLKGWCRSGFQKEFDFQTTKAHDLQTDNEWHYFELPVASQDLASLINDDKESGEQQVAGSFQSNQGSWPASDAGGAGSVSPASASGAGGGETVWCGFFVQTSPDPIMLIYDFNDSGQVQSLVHSESLRVMRERGPSSDQIMICNKKTKSILSKARKRDFKFKQNEWKLTNKSGNLEPFMFTAKVAVAFTEKTDLETDAQKSMDTATDASEKESKAKPRSPITLELVADVPFGSLSETKLVLDGLRDMFKDIGIDTNSIVLMTSTARNFFAEGEEYPMIARMILARSFTETEASHLAKFRSIGCFDDQYPKIEVKIRCEPKSKLDFPTKIVPWFGWDSDISDTCENAVGETGKNGAVLNKLEIKFQTTDQALKGKTLPLVAPEHHGSQQEERAEPGEADTRKSRCCRFWNHVKEFISSKERANPGETDTGKRRCCQFWNRSKEHAEPGEEDTGKSSCCGFWNRSKDDLQERLLPKNENADTGKRRCCGFWNRSNDDKQESPSTKNEKADTNNWRCCFCCRRKELKEEQSKLVASCAQGEVEKPHNPEGMKWILDYYQGYNKQRGELEDVKREMVSIKMLFETGQTDLEFSGSKPGQSLTERVFAIFICTDAFSETSQTINFLHNGQPVYCALSFLGIMWNVIEGNLQIPPNGLWDALGRGIQADVMESVLQLVKYKQYTKLFFVKKSIKARTQKLMHLPVIFVALTNLSTTHNTMLPAIGAWIQSQTSLSDYWTDWIEFAICFVIFAGNIGTLSSALLSTVSFAFGIGEAEQWVEAFEKVEEIEKEDERLKGKTWFFEPQWKYRIIYICHSLGVFIGLSSSYSCFSNHMKTLVGSFILLVFFSRLPLFASTATWEEHFKVIPFGGKVQFNLAKCVKGIRTDDFTLDEKTDTCGSCGRILSLAFMAVFFVLHPYGYMWPTKLSMRGPPKNYFSPKPKYTDNKENAKWNLKWYRFAFAWFFLTHAACFGILWYLMLFTSLSEDLVFMQNFHVVMHWPPRVMATIPLVQMLLTLVGFVSTIATIPAACFITYWMQDTDALDRWWKSSLYDEKTTVEAGLWL